MKKFLGILLVMSIALSASACVNFSGTSTTDSKDSSTVSAAKDNVWGLNETATFDKLKITALDMKESKGVDYFEAESGKIFVGVKFEIENISDEAQTVSSLLLFNAYADDIKCSYSLSANIAFGDGSLDGEISPGKKLVGWYSVEVPEDWNQVELEFKDNMLSDKKAKFVFEK